jgi:dTDP-4-dehydrorhamnose reductase
MYLEMFRIFKAYMTVYIYGSSGMLGGYLKKQFPDAVCLARDESCDLHEGDVIINAAGVIPHSGQTDYSFNTTFPIALGVLCQSKKAHLIHFSTDCVFSGTKGNYTEDDTPDADTEYGKSKAKGDTACATIIRTSIIGEETRNKRSLLEWVRSREGTMINGFTNHLWNGVTCWQLSKIVRQIIETQNFWIGVRHVYSPTPVSKYQLVQMIADVYELKKTSILPFTEWNSNNKTLSSVHPKMFDIPDLRDQLIEQRGVYQEDT